MLLTRFPSISSYIKNCLFIMMLSISANTATYAADIALSMRAEKEIPVMIQGVEVPILKPIRKVNVNDTILITIHYKNQFKLPSPSFLLLI